MAGTGGGGGWNALTSSSGNHTHSFTTDSQGNHTHSLQINSSGDSEVKMKNIAGKYYCRLK